MPTVTLRPAKRADVPLILRLIRELADYERAADEVEATEATVASSLFDADANAHALICDIDGEAAGFAVYFFTYSTWLARKGLYLEDLYITPAARGHGAGKALLKYLAQRAVELGCKRFEWSVLNWNTPAIAFYEAAGARPQSEWTTYRLSGGALRDFANG